VTQISWTDELLRDIRNGRTATLKRASICVSTYRPFIKQHMYFDIQWIQRRYQMNAIFPNMDSKNSLICVSGNGGNKDHSVFISDMIVDLNCLDAGTQCFPLYYYDEPAKKKKKAPSVGQIDLSGQTVEAEYIRKDGVSDFILEQARKLYGGAVAKKDIFFYVYGFLHSVKYRNTFADDLKKALPRIPLVESTEDFWSFSKAGRKLAELHLNYENEAPLDEVTVSGNRMSYHIEKMRFLAKDKKDIIKFNPYITIENIPDRAYEYVVNGKSAIEWIMERYQVKTNKDSGIVNDPNLYAEEIGQPDYVLKLLLSVIAVSVRTQDIVNSLPRLSW